MRFSRRCLLPVGPAAAFAWHERPGAFERLAPPWQSVEVAERHGSIRDGDRTVIRLRQGPLRLRWVAEHRGYRAGEKFEDVQLSGPFRRWHHKHRFEEGTDGKSWLSDEIEYSPPLGPLGALVAGRWIERDLQRLFDYRHAVTRADLQLHEDLRAMPRQRIGLTGSSGLVGTALRAVLSTGGHEVVRFVRRATVGADEIEWRPESGLPDPDQAEGLDAVVHLAGENIGDGRWIAARRRAIRSSRVEATARLVAALGALRAPPHTLVSASAVGYYGDTGQARVSEEGAPGDGFLADVCRGWEEASGRAPLERTVQARFGVILSPRGGALKKMLPPFRAGAGGRVGDGRQQFSWIAVDDAVGALLHILGTPTLEGPVNVVAPQSVTNRQLTAALGRVLRRPTMLPLPAAAVRLLFGAMGEETLLASTGATPPKLLAAGYRFRFTELEAALRHLLGAGARRD